MSTMYTSLNRVNFSRCEILKRRKLIFQKQMAKVNWTENTVVYLNLSQVHSIRILLTDCPVHTRSSANVCDSWAFIFLSDLSDPNGQSNFISVGKRYAKILLFVEECRFLNSSDFHLKSGDLSVYLTSIPSTFNLSTFDELSVLQLSGWEVLRSVDIVMCRKNIVFNPSHFYSSISHKNLRVQWYQLGRSIAELLGISFTTKFRDMGCRHVKGHLRATFNPTYHFTTKYECSLEPKFLLLVRHIYISLRTQIYYD